MSPVVRRAAPGGNEFTSCIPESSREIESNHLGDLGLSSCEAELREGLPVRSSGPSAVERAAEVLTKGSTWGGLEGLRRIGALAAIAVSMLLNMAACDWPVGDSSPLAMPGESDRLTVEVQEQPTDAVDLRPTVVATPIATPQAARIPTRMPTLEPDSIPIEYYGTPCHPEIIVVPLPWLSDQFVQWSPEGDQVLFTQGAVLYSVGEDGTRLRELARGSVVLPRGRGEEARGVVVLPDLPPSQRGAIGRMMAFDIAPDGKRIAYSTCEYPKGEFGEAVERLGWRQAMNRHRYQIATASIEGAQPRQLTNNAGFANYPAWSPDGERIAFLAGGNPIHLPIRMSLMTMAADGTDQRTLVDWLESLALRRPAWSPDGTRLAFAADHGKSGLSIYTIKPDGTDLRRLTETLSAPAWSPSGERIAFARADGRKVAIYTMAADGRDERRVTSIPEVGWNSHKHPMLSIRTLQWSPDGSKVLFVENRELAGHDCSRSPTTDGVYVVGADGSGLVGLGITEPKVYSYAAAAWSPDGTRIAVLADAEHEDQWAFDCDYTDAVMEGLPRPLMLFTMAADGTDMQVLAPD